MNPIKAFLCISLALLSHSSLHSLEAWDYRGELFLKSKQSGLRKHFLLETPQTKFTQKSLIEGADVEAHWEWTEQFQATLRGEGSHREIRSGTELESKNHFRLIEGSITSEITPLFFIDIGKVLEKWGTGYAFNPVNALLNNKNPSDPTGVREGTTMLKLEVLWEEMTFTAILAGVADENNAEQAFMLPDSKRKRRLAFKWNHGLGNFDLSWVHVQGGLDGESLQDQLQGSTFESQIMEPLTGISWTTVFGEALEIHGEYVVQRGRDRRIPATTTAAIFNQEQSLILPAISAYQQDQANKDRLFSNFLLGGQYTFENGGNLVWEWLHDEQGYTKKEWGRIKKAIENAQLDQASNPDLFPENNPFQGFLAQTLLYLRRTAFRQNYGFLRLLTPEFGARYESESITILNLDDSSFLFREKLSKSWGDHWKGSLDWTTFQGSRFSEYALNPSHDQTSLEITYFF